MYPAFSLYTNGRHKLNIYNFVSVYIYLHLKYI
jgi:hypothetical protein